MNPLVLVLNTTLNTSDIKTGPGVEILPSASALK